MNMKTEDTAGDPRESVAEISRIIHCNEAWFDASHDWLASDERTAPRPLSLASLDALRLMELDFTREDFETREIALYRWLHTAPLRAVKAAIWTGEWRGLFSAPEPLDEIIIAAFRAERARLAAILAAVTVSVRARPKRGKDDTPPDVIAPTLATFRAVTIASALRADLDHVRWHLPVVQALQVYHHALWESGRWTVRPGEKATAEQLSDLSPEWMVEDENPKSETRNSNQ